YAGQLYAAITRVSGVGPVLTYNWTAAVGTWHHIAYTFNNSSSTQVLFVDGIAVASGAVSGPIVYDTHPFLIGADIQEETPTLFLGGLLDEAALYNRALSAPEIAAIYSAGASGKCITSYPPVITLQPTDRTVVAGDSATFSVAAAGAQPISYQWRLNGVNINGATGSSFTLAHPQPADAGLYSAMLSNSAGTVLSSNALLTVNPSPPCVAPPSGLVSWWQAEGNASDVLGTNNGTLVNGGTFAPGKVGQAFSFNGVNQYLSVPDSPALRPTNLTLEGWVNFSTLSGDPQSLFQKPYGVVDSDSFGVAYYAGQLFAAITRASGVGTVISYNWTPAVGTWHHVAYAFNNASSTQVLFVDGIAVASSVVSGPIVYDTHPFLIGAAIQKGAPMFFLGGLLDEAALYNRALSVEEIAAIYNAGSAGKCTSVVPPTPHGATATATMVNDFVVGVTITDGGYGYTNTPTVRIVGGGGNGAQAVAVVSNGVVIAINILDAGFGYTSTPDIYIAPPFIPQPTLGIAALSLLSFTNLTVGTNYQLQLFSSHTWSNLGVAFTAASSTFMQYVPGTAG
ncbi:MAG: immunoglobulin domain-containing protein, partial [Verrucomicrobia bacterium]|nr:immunoglobulin domain-containing protein [Verrucomicrobiota bacterium]